MPAPEQLHSPAPEAAATDGPSPFTPSGVVTLTTDFGHQDPYVGIVHGVILGCAANVRIVDLCHRVPPQDVARAAYFLAHAQEYFPRGTVHVAVVDPGVGSERRILVAFDRGCAYLAPDNGLLNSVLSSSARVRALDVERFALPRRSLTFHGRDVFAPTAAAIATGQDPLAAGIGPELALDRVAPNPARTSGDRCEAAVLFADHFGNLILDVRGDELLPEPSAWCAVIEGRDLAVSGTYADASRGGLVALVDSFGALEIAVRDGSAAERLGLGAGDRVNLRRIR